MSTTVAVRFNTDDLNKIEPLLDFVKSLDAVSSVEIGSQASDKKLEMPNHAAIEGFLSIAEIKRLYPDEWVLLGDPIFDGMDVLGGKVLLNDPGKRNMALRGKGLVSKYARSTHIFTGTFPESATIGILRRISSKP